MKINKLKVFALIIIGFALILSVGCEGPEGATGPDGAQGPQGEAGPQGPQGPEGNANVKRYIFDMHDFSAMDFNELEFTGVSLEEFEESIWLVYLVLQFPDGQDTYLVPGFGTGATSFYRVFNSSFETGSQVIAISLLDGPGETYENVYVFQIPSSSTMDMTSKSLPNGLPSDLDVSDYNAVLNYFGDNVETIKKY